MNVFKSVLKKQPSIVIENEHLRAEVVTKGGRIVSLLDKEKKREFLVQQPTKNYCTGSYAEKMTDYRPAGFDDMFPTIDACHYEDFPWEGHRMPDHGEVWSLDWEHDIGANEIKLSVYGVRLPYLFSKTIRLTGDKKLSIEYEAENLSEFDMNCIWAAHPMLKVQEDTEILLDESCNEAYCMLCFDGRLGQYGDTFTWPEIKDKHGRHHVLNKIRGLESKNTEKYYFKNKLKKGICTIKYPSDNTMLKLEFPVDKVPYFGLLVEEGGWDDELYIIPEPCTAPYDRIDISKAHKKESVLPAKGLYKWYLDISIDQ